MPYYKKSEDWLHQSTLLIQAHRDTTLVTTHYTIKPAHRQTKAEKQQAAAAAAAQEKPHPPPPSPSPSPSSSTSTSKPPRGHLVFKTYDPTSGICLKYKTSKAAEVTRLVQMLGTLARYQAGVEKDFPSATATPAAGGGDETMVDAAVGGGGGEGAGSGTQTPVPGQVAAGSGPSGGGGGAGGGKGKKKKGKR